jgi:ABC-type molybdate transport system substrate-binding protein
MIAVRKINGEAKRLFKGGQSISGILVAACIAFAATLGWTQARKDGPEPAVAAAADLSAALTQIGDGCQKKTGVTAKLWLNAIPYGN